MCTVAGARPQPAPRSCDTFVVIPESGSGLPVCFGKNSDRPSDEEHEVVFVPRQQHPDGASVRCTYIEVPQVQETLAVVLSRPAWLWGCEMGANECGVVGGNEAVSTRLEAELGSRRRLLGMDLLRLALERSRTAREAVDACTALLERHGQGGGCAEGDDDWTYENGFLFADAQEAFVVETAGVSWWAAERIPGGTCRNISNGISIRTELFAVHAGLQSHCRAQGWWDGSSPFDFKATLTGQTSVRALAPAGRERAGRDFLAAMARDIAQGSVRTREGLAEKMMAVLRDEKSGICFRDLRGFNSTGSQVSLLHPKITDNVHFFTCSSDPMLAAYKRFTFNDDAGRAEGLGPRTLELWRQHRRRALRRLAPPAALRGLEARALRPAGGAPALAELVEEELGLLEAAGS